MLDKGVSASRQSRRRQRGQEVINLAQISIIQNLEKSMSRGCLVGIEYARTECDSSEEIEFEPSCKTIPHKHKTELCKTYSELGYCNYGDKCRFAHGKHELVHLPINLELRKRKCNGYWGKGYCSYGIRCQFGHNEDKPQPRAVWSIASQYLGRECRRSTPLMQILSTQ